MRHAPCACILIAGACLFVSSAWAAPTLSGGIIDDLQGLEARLKSGEHAAVEAKATRQAERLAGGNASDRWARALYLQLAANAEVRRGNVQAAVEHLATARGTRGVEPAQADRWLRQEAGLRARLGETGRARELLGDWLERHGGDADTHWLMAQLQAESSRWEQAADWAQRALAGDASPSQQRLGLAATALQRAGRQKEALAVLERQLAGAEDDPQARRRAAGLAQRMGDPGRAAALWETAWRRGVLSGADDLMQRIRLHLAAGTPARAAEILSRTLEEGSLDDSLENRRLLAEAWQAARDHDRALTAWREVAERSDAAEDWLRLGQLATGWDRLELAREALQRARQGGATEASDWLASLPENKGDAPDGQASAEADG
ncbi:tetratricopeptide repeat protein [Halomonas elongata]|uniref:tetratricopeptide repeat protein n=1 Tax=Halomonas elongata TaxID=2746 RepID=UPI0038D432E7